MSAPTEAPPAPAPAFGTNIGEAPGSDFLTSMHKAMGLPTEPVEESNKADAKPAAPVAAKQPEKPAAQATPDDDIPTEIKSEKARLFENADPEVLGTFPGYAVVVTADGKLFRAAAREQLGLLEQRRADLLI